jgi:hypothetical protein
MVIVGLTMWLFYSIQAVWFYDCMLVCTNLTFFSFCCVCLVALSCFVHKLCSCTRIKSKNNCRLLLSSVDWLTTYVELRTISTRRKWILLCSFVARDRKA